MQTTPSTVAESAASIPPVASGAPAAEAEKKSDGIGLADNFDSFLKLLTTQLTSQDPLAPMDANQFTQQLVQFSGVEQAIKTNSTLEQLVSLVQGDRLSQGLDYLGNEVEAAGETVHLGASGGARFHYELPRDAAEIAVLVRDELGRTVFQGPGNAAVGRHQLPWDGLDGQGNRLPEGLYQLEVIASDASGAPIDASTGIAGVVDGVELKGDALMLSVDGVLVDRANVTALRRPTGEA